MRGLVPWVGHFWCKNILVPEGTKICQGGGGNKMCIFILVRRVLKYRKSAFIWLKRTEKYDSVKNLSNNLSFPYSRISK